MIHILCEDSERLGIFYRKNPDSLIKFFPSLFPMLWITFTHLTQSRAYIKLLCIWHVIFFMYLLMESIRHLCFEVISLKCRLHASCIRKSLCHLPSLLSGTTLKASLMRMQSIALIELPQWSGIPNTQAFFFFTQAILKEKLIFLWRALAEKNLYILAFGTDYNQMTYICIWSCYLLSSCFPDS